MIKIVWDPSFKKIYKKKVRNNSDLKKKFWNTMEVFSKTPFDSRLRTHKLTGKLEGLWASGVLFLRKDRQNQVVAIDE